MQKKTKILLAVFVTAIVIALAVAIPLIVINDEDETPNPFWIGSMVLDEVPLIDGHNDLPYNFYMFEKNQINNFDFDSDLLKHPVWGPAPNSFTDMPRLRQGKVGGQFWVAYVSCTATQYKDAVEQTLDQIDVIKRFVHKYRTDLQFVTTADGIMDAFRNNKIASLIGVEGGHSIDSRLSVLRMYYDLGVRYMTLTHNCNQPWIEASQIDNNLLVPKRNLTTWGEMVIDEMNRIGMLIDLSHVSYGVMHAVLDRTRAPVIFSHSSSHKVFAHNRNVQDDVLEKLVLNKGIIMVNFYSGFICPDENNCKIMDVVNHLNHIKSITGPDHIGIGGDYDGVSKTPDGLEDVSNYPDLFDLLASPDHGYEPWTREELKKLAGENLIRVYKEAESIRDALLDIPPIEALIPDADLYEAANQTCRSNFRYSPDFEGMGQMRAYYETDDLIGTAC